MLMMSRREGETILIGEDIEVDCTYRTLARAGGNSGSAFDADMGARSETGTRGESGGSGIGVAAPPDSQMESFSRFFQRER
jgi:hypothetical protein